MNTQKTRKNRLNEISFKTNALLNLMFVFIAISCVAPLLLVISVSLTSEKAIALYGYRFIPAEFSTYAYNFIFQLGEAIIRAYGITILVSIAGTVLSVLIIAMYAYPISRKDFKYRNKFTFFVFFTMIFNGGLVPWYMVYVNFLHLKNSLLALIVPMLVNTWYIMIMRTFYQITIPDGIVESAKIDGAGEFRTFVQIVLPLSLPGLATVALFQTLNYWNDWFLALMFIEDQRICNLQFLLYRILSSITYLTQSTSTISIPPEVLANMPSESARMAMAIIVIGPIIFAYPFFQKYFIKGLTVGAVKG